MPNVTFTFRTQNAESVRREIQRNLDAAREGQRAVSGTSAQVAQRSATAEQNATRVALTESAKRTQARQREAQASAAAERTVTAAVASEEGKRTSAHTSGIRARIRSFMEYVRAAKSGEEQITAAQTREQRRRANTWGQRGSTAASAAMGVGSTLHGQIQDARRARAEAERTTTIAFRQGGATNAEAVSRTRELQQFAASRGMRFEDLASAAMASQTQFSTLQGATAQERSTAFERFLSSAEFARNSGNNVAEVTRLQGFFAQQGLGTGTQNALLRFAAGAANRGSVELGTMTREALMPITQRITTAQSQLGPGASEADRQRVAVDTFRQAVAELQVEALGGTTARRGGMALSSVAQFLTDPNRQDKMRTNILQARGISTQQRAALERELFTRGPGGHRVLATTNPLEFVERFQRVMGNNPLAMQTMFAGGGHGNPQSLLVNQRAALAQLLSMDPAGRSRVRALMDPNVSLTERELQEGANLYGNDTLAQLNRNEETRLTALTDNTSAINKLSNALAGWQASNPLLSTALGTGASALLPAVAGSAGSAAAASSAAGGLGGVAAAGGAAMAAAGAAVLAAGGAGALAGDIANEVVEQGNIGRNANGTMQDQARSIFEGSTWSDLVQELRGLPENLGTAIRSASLNPQAALHANAVMATGANSVAPESRANR